MSSLILRIEKIETGIPAIELIFPRLTLADDLVGKAVALGQSSVPGVWSVVAIGRLSTLEHSESSTCVRIDTLFHLNEPLAAVSTSTWDADSNFRPLDCAIVDVGEMEQLLSGNPLDYSQHQDEHMLHMAEVGSWGVQAGQAVGYVEFVAQDRHFFYRVAQAYDWQCAFLHYGEHALSGRRKDGVVLGIDSPHWSQGAISEAIFINPIMSFPFREGLVAIGDDYEILRSSQLSAGLRTILDVANPKALLSLPERYEDWPDLVALERHRRRFGY